MLRRPFFVLSAVATVAAMACGADGDGEEGAVPAETDAAAAVVVTDMVFSPEVIEVDVGEAVTWTFEDRMRHDVAFEDGPASPRMKTGTWERTFEQAGSYDYVCTIHPNMTGTVTVG